MEDLGNRRRDKVVVVVVVVVSSSSSSSSSTATLHAIDAATTGVNAAATSIGKYRSDGNGFSAARTETAKRTCPIRAD
jgi:hypothetical protein